MIDSVEIRTATPMHLFAVFFECGNPRLIGLVAIIRVIIGHICLVHLQLKFKLEDFQLVTKLLLALVLGNVQACILVCSRFLQVVVPEGVRVRDIRNVGQP